MLTITDVSVMRDIGLTATIAAALLTLSVSNHCKVILGWASFNFHNNDIVDYYN